jgi:HEAT repeat protein
MQSATFKYISDPTTAANLFGEISKYFGLHKSLLVQAVNWLRYLPHSSPLREGLLKLITREIHSNGLVSVKTRLATTLALTGIKETEPVLGHLLQSPSPPVRRAAALAAGLLGRSKLVPQLTNLLGDDQPNNFAACYALGLIADPAALEAIADSLMHGSELLRRSAAEALSRHPSEGHPALREGSKMDDILVRYAVVHGLKQIKAPWSAEILDFMRIEDDQWVVRDAAQHAFEEISAPSRFVPRPPLDLTKSAWLKELASEQNVETSDEETCLDLMLNALQEGDDESKQAALLALRQEGFTDIFPAIFTSMQNSSFQTRDEAETTLWYTSLTGKLIPDPADFNLTLTH